MFVYLHILDNEDSFSKECHIYIQDQKSLPQSKFVKKSLAPNVQVTNICEFLSHKSTA